MERLSYYNHFFDWADRLFVIYNARAGGVICLDPGDYARLTGRDRNGWQQLSSRVKTMLRKNGMLIPADMDELEDILTHYHQKRTRGDKLSLTIAPTLDCNFSCLYCYETRKPGRMTREVQKGVLRFIRSRLNEGGKLSVNWYGGEPLLVPDTVLRLTEEMRDLARGMDAVPDFSLVTNGYLLTPRLSEQLVTLGISDVQITLDGPPHIHDVRRKLRNGDGTFDKILDNLRRSAALFETVRIRVNLDWTNRTAWKQVKEILNEAGVLAHVQLSLGLVESLSDATADYGETCMGVDSFSEVVADWMVDSFNSHSSDALKLPLMPVCGAVSRNAFVIAPDGSLTRCWNDVGNSRKSIGHVKEPDRLNNVSDRWRHFEPTDWPACRDCNILPICMGGCPDRLQRLGPGPACVRWKHCLREAVILHTLSKLKEDENEKTG